jgi:CRISPR-associated endonuclease/helicase Cas3
VTELPSFEEVYTAAWRHDPFPWQRRLVRDVLADGWPAVLDLPTGSGKTSALDVALYCLAAAPDRMPRRVVLVVDRRIVVDQGAGHARELCDQLTCATAGPLAALAARLRSLWGATDGPPFAVAVMRGGMPRDNDWARRPDQPVLGVSTVDQLGSRLLFRGYGVSGRSAPIHAGLLGNDTLILLDEVHLANAFARTLDQIRTRFRGAEVALPGRFAVTQMSATARTAPAAGRMFGLDADDRANPVLARRLAASKRAILRPVKVTGDDEPRKLEAMAARAVQEALALQARGARTVAIVVNRVETARLARRQLAAHRGTEALLLTGRMRPIDRDHVVRAHLIPGAGAGRDRAAAARPLVVVATQCIEAGADLDFDAIVTECASLDALRQRFGRVDRRGELGRSESVVLGRSDQVADGAGADPVYGTALGATWRWLVAHASEDAIDFGIAALPGDASEALLPPAPEPPVLLPAHLDLWAQTSQPPVVEPDVALWLHGPTRPGADVQVIWRAHADLAIADDERLVERLQRCRPSALEAVTVPLAAVRRWLEAQPVEAMADVEGESEGESAPRPRRDPGVPEPTVLCWRGDDSARIPARELRPGDVIVCDTERGGLWESSFDPASEAPVIDLGDLAQLRGRGIATVRLHREALAVWQLPAAMLETIPAVQPDDPVAQQASVKDWLARWPETTESPLVTEPEWQALRSALQARPRVHVVARADDASHPDDYLIAIAPTRLPAEVEDAVTEDDDSSFRRQAISLADHSRDVRTRAGRYARALGFAEPVAADLALAAWLHDVGKADPRFQRWLAGGAELHTGTPGTLLAKSALQPGNARERKLALQRSGYPRGTRHELLSLAMVQDHDVLRDAADRDLVLHLIASHHGWCRPFPPPVRDPEVFDVSIQHGDHALVGSTRHELARLDSGVASRFWRLVGRYGWWGLAWLEAVIRLADHRASEHPEVAP